MTTNLSDRYTCSDCGGRLRVVDEGNTDASAWEQHECADCGESHGWRDYQDWHDEITPDTDLLCPECQRERDRLRRRRENNEPLHRYLSDSGGDADGK
jgi:predicted RNA-binding Zn-ribbon protein involved in translation (DUF1610 family)